MELKLSKVGFRTIRKLLSRNYHCAKIFYNLSFHFSKPRGKELLLICQMGKVGSTTVLKSLKTFGLDMPIYQVHFLSQEIIDRLEKIYINNFSDHSSSSATDLLWKSQCLRKQVKKGLKGQKWKIVSLVRDPIARNISAFFQGANMIITESDHQVILKSKIYDYEMNFTTEGIEKLTKIFLHKFDNETPLVFFDREFKGVLGIDVFSSKFPKSKGYKIYEGEHIDVLLMRLEDLDKIASEAFKDFLGIEGFTLVKSNISKEKDYADIYRKVLDSLRLPSSYIEEMYTSKYSQHFYSEEEISTFKAKWEAQSIA